MESLKQLMVYTGIANATDFNITSFPLYGSNFSSYVCYHYQSLDFILEKILFLDFPKIGGRSRYFSYYWMFQVPSIEKKIFFHIFSHISTKNDSRFFCVDALARG